MGVRSTCCNVVTRRQSSSATGGRHFLRNVYQLQTVAKRVPVFNLYGCVYPYSDHFVKGPCFIGFL